MLNALSSLRRRVSGGRLVTSLRLRPSSGLELSDLRNVRTPSFYSAYHLRVLCRVPTHRTAPFPVHIAIFPLSSRALSDCIRGAVEAVQIRFALGLRFRRRAAHSQPAARAAPCAAPYAWRPPYSSPRDMTCEWAHGLPGVWRSMVAALISMSPSSTRQGIWRRCLGWRQW